MQYAQPITKKGAAKAAAAAATEEPVKKSNHVQRILEERKKGDNHNVLIPRCTDMSPDAKIDPLLEQQFVAGRLYASISSRPGQSGRADGYVLEGKELEVGWMY